MAIIDAASDRDCEEFGRYIRIYDKDGNRMGRFVRVDTEKKIGRILVPRPDDLGAVLYVDACFDHIVVSSEAPQRIIDHAAELGISVDTPEEKSVAEATAVDKPHYTKIYTGQLGQ